MATYEILDDKGKVKNTIIADAAFVEANYPGKYIQKEDAVVEAPAPAPEPIDPIAEIKTKLDTLLAELAIVKKQTEKV